MDMNRMAFGSELIAVTVTVVTPPRPTAVWVTDSNVSVSRTPEAVLTGADDVEVVGADEVAAGGAHDVAGGTTAPGHGLSCPTITVSLGAGRPKVPGT
jgi:hypothetical protein